MKRVGHNSLDGMGAANTESTSSTGAVFHCFLINKSVKNRQRGSKRSKRGRTQASLDLGPVVVGGFCFSWKWKRPCCVDREVVFQIVRERDEEIVVAEREEAILELIDRAEWEAAWKALSEVDIPEIDIFPELGRK